MAAINVGGTLALEMNGNGTLGPGLDQLDWQWLPTIRRGANAWPALTTNVSAWLRIVKRNLNGLENYTAYSSADDVNWTQSGTWVHTLGSGANDLSVRWKSCWVNCDG